MLRIAFNFIFLFAAVAAQARVFNPKESAVAAYIRGTGGQSNLSYSAYADSSGSSTLFQLKDKPA